MVVKKNSAEDRLIELVKTMKKLADRIEDLGEKKTELQKEYDDVRYEKIPSLMDEMGVDNITIKGIGRVNVTADMRASIRASAKEDALEWLREHGAEHLITETLNASTLKAYAKEKFLAGEPLPEELFSIHQFSRASITKS